MKIESQLFPGFRTAGAQVHPGASVGDGDPLLVTTPPLQWHYALSIPYARPRVFAGRSSESVIVEMDLEVETGEVGVACVRSDLKTVLSERYASAREGRVLLRQIVPSSELSWLIVRNSAVAGAASVARVFGARVVERMPGDLLGMIDTGRRHYETEGVPVGGGVESFDDEAATRINDARLKCLADLGLPLERRSVLDVGCGVGHLSRFFVERGCRYVGVEGRAENVARMKELYPDAEAHVGDVQRDSLARHGRFDVALCFGLLYHLEDPVGALRNIAGACDDLLLLETMVCDSSKSVLRLVDESKSFNQALAGLGCRPSPSFIVMALNRIGFDRIYTPKRPPRHEDFEIHWQDDLARQRDGHDLRCMFIASRTPLSNDRLIQVL
jgi:SAM-dependent methyltransferase